MKNVLGITAGLTLAWFAQAGIESGIYQTVAGATVVEMGDNVTNGSRIVPLSATLTFDLTGVQPSLTAVIHDAVLEGGSAYGELVLGGREQPFELTVHSSSGAQLTDGSYRFSGDYLKDLYPSGTQYLFDWRFTGDTGGNPVWNGQTYWSGGHIWLETISDVALVPEPTMLALVVIGAGSLFARSLSRSCGTENDAKCNSCLALNK